MFPSHIKKKQETGKINFINIQYLSNQLYPKILFQYIINIKIRGIFNFLVSLSLNFMCIYLPSAQQPHGATAQGYSINESNSFIDC